MKLNCFVLQKQNFFISSIAKQKFDMGKTVWPISQLRSKGLLFHATSQIDVFYLILQKVSITIGHVIRGNFVCTFSNVL